MWVQGAECYMFDGGAEEHRWVQMGADGCMWLRGGVRTQRNRKNYIKTDLHGREGHVSVPYDRHTHTHAHAYNTHALTHTHNTHTHIYTHTYTHTYTYTRAHTHTHTHTHTHSDAHATKANEPNTRTNQKHTQTKNHTSMIIARTKTAYDSREQHTRTKCTRTKSVCKPKTHSPKTSTNQKSSNKNCYCKQFAICKYIAFAFNANAMYCKLQIVCSLQTIFSVSNNLLLVVVIVVLCKLQ